MWLVNTNSLKNNFLKKSVTEVGLSLHWVPDLLPLQRDGVPAELHRDPAGLCADCEHQHVLAAGHGDHPDHLDCQEQEHEGENQNCHRMLAGVIKNELIMNAMTHDLKLTMISKYTLSTLEYKCFGNFIVK